jgi:outer membrane lipoprotein SlyB
MKKYTMRFLILASILTFISGCARDLSNDVYSSDATAGLTLQGVVISARPITIKNADKMADNGAGMLTGGALGGVMGSGVGKGRGNTVSTIGGVVAGGLLGAAAEGRLSQAKGYEYIVKVDTQNLSKNYYEGSSRAMRNALASVKSSGLITVIQGDTEKNHLKEGRSVYVIVSESRARVIAY